MKGILFLFFLFGATAMAQEKVGGPKVQIIKIQTSAICEMCEERIENKLNYTKGVVYAELDLDTKVLTVKFKTKMITADQVRQIIADLGYDADDVKKNQEAHAKLPKCCRQAGECGNE